MLILKVQSNIYIYHEILVARLRAVKKIKTSMVAMGYHTSPSLSLASTTAE